MNYKKFKLCTIFLLGLGLTGLQAQKALPATGGNVSGSGGTVSYSVGQVVYKTQTGTSSTMAQGVQQPFRISVVNAIEEANGISLELSVFPNPVTDFIRLRIDKFEVQQVSYQLYDITGNMILRNKVESNETNILMQNFLPAVYFLKVFKDKKEVKVFKIIKK